MQQPLQDFAQDHHGQHVAFWYEDEHRTLHDPATPFTDTIQDPSSCLSAQHNDCLISDRTAFASIDGVSTQVC